MLKASGCINSTSTDALEVLTNTIPIDLHLKMRQAQEVVGISAKHEEDPLKKDTRNGQQTVTVMVGNQQSFKC